MSHALPPPPRKPDLDECCGNGCDPCVFDRYHDAVAAWKRACREIEAKRLAAERHHDHGK